MENKKSEKVDLRKKVGQNFLMGLSVALSLSLVAFEWRTPEYEAEPIERGEIVDVPDELPPVTYRKVKELAKPKPKINRTVQKQIVKEIFTEIQVTKDPVVKDPVIASSEATPTTLVDNDPEIIVEEEHPRVWVEQMPEYMGGHRELLKYLSQNVKYPRRAIDAGIHGTVYVEFIVNKDGSISDVKTARGIGGGCDQEAERVVKNMKNWKPGVQGGHNVRVLFRLPIKFTLKN